MSRPAVVLLSGGLDSATVLAMVQAEGFTPTALSFDYGQRHRVELDAAAKVAERAGVEQRTARLDLRAFGGSALTDDIDVPKHDNVSQLDSSKVPSTYVPARNTIMLAHALALAEVMEANAIFSGVNALDYSGYPDCRPEFMAAFQYLANLATVRATQHGQHMRVYAPLIKMTKAEIIAKGLELGVDYGITRSCYDPQWIEPAIRNGFPGTDRPFDECFACGHCDSCLLRIDAFASLGKSDPAPYITQVAA